MHSGGFSNRCSFLAGTALALILAISAAASAAPQEESFQAPQPTTRNYSMPGSMPKPSATMDDGIRFRGSLPASRDGGLQPRTTTPLAPAPIETRREEPARPAAGAKPVIAPEAARAQAEPEPAAKVAPAPEAAAKVAPAAVVAPEPVTRPAAAPVPERTPRAVAAPAPVVAPAPERVTRPAAVAAAPNAASEADVGNQLREVVTSKQFDRVIGRASCRERV